MSAHRVLLLPVVGIAAGLLARRTTRKPGVGLFGDEILNVTGAFAGVWIVGSLGISSGGFIGAIAATSAGAHFLLYTILFAKAARSLTAANDLLTTAPSHFRKSHG